MFGYFYHEILRRTVIAFGTLFNGITIKHLDDNGATVSVMKVPLAYGPIQKFLARIEQTPDLNKPTSITLPRMSFEFTGLQYDPSRKVTQTQTFLSKKADDGSTIKKVYMPVPYNMQFQLSVMAKLNDDCLQIVEQILPYFQPSYNVSVNLVGEINEHRDVPIIMDNISFTDDYEGDFSTRRALIYTLNFTAKTYLFGPIPDQSTGIIKKATLDYMTNMDTKTPRRELRYSVTPRAIQDYTGTVATFLNENIDATETQLEVGDGTALEHCDYITIDDEEMWVKSINGNSIVVQRGKDSTIATSHVNGAGIHKMTGKADATLPLTGDNAGIEMGDDFGFNETTSFYQDFKTYSSAQGGDVDA